eukprot:scaffold2418_cov296-Prasinococcus_capsulatus_cf.AAC.6
MPQNLASTATFLGTAARDSLVPCDATQRSLARRAIAQGRRWSQSSSRWWRRWSQHRRTWSTLSSAIGSGSRPWSSRAAASSSKERLGAPRPRSRPCASRARWTPSWPGG